MKMCRVCGGEIINPTGKNQKTCPECLLARTLPRPCTECGAIMEKPGSLQTKCRDCQKKARSEAGREIGKRNYQGSGPSHHSWKTGIGTFTQHRKDSCERCGSPEHLCAHHRDEDRTNNSPENIETLCKKCHQKHHRAGSSPRYKEAMKSVWADDEFRARQAAAVAESNRRRKYE